MIILLDRQVSTPADSWTEYLCLDKSDAENIELSTRAREGLAHISALDDDVVWPEGYDPEHSEENDDDVLPVSIGGKRVWGCEGEILLGCDLVPITDTASAQFTAGEIEAAQAWLEHAGWRRARGFEAAWLKVCEAIAALSK